MRESKRKRERKKEIWKKNKWEKDAKKGKEKEKNGVEGV